MAARVMTTSVATLARIEYLVAAATITSGEMFPTTDSLVKTFLMVVPTLTRVTEDPTLIRALM
jgi:hypothetical protein